MTDEIFQEPYELLLSGFHQPILIWTPPAMPWVDPRYETEDGTVFLMEDFITRSFWIIINHQLQGGKPNRWIRLVAAVWIITQKLDVLPGEARKLLQSEARPPAVPWVGLFCARPKDGEALASPREIDGATLNVQEVDFSFESMRSLAPEGHFLDIHVELNHLEAWLEKKRPAPVVEPAPPDESSSAEPASQIAPIKEKRPGKPLGSYHGPFRKWLLLQYTNGRLSLDASVAPSLPGITAAWKAHCESMQVPEAARELPKGRRLREVIARIRDEALTAPGSP